MRRFPFPKIILFRSLFTKWMLLATISMLVIILLIVIFIDSVVKSSITGIHKWMPELIQERVELLGHPPDFEKAMMAKEKLGVMIRYQGEKEGWSTSELIPPISHFKFESIKNDVGIRILRDNLQVYLLFKNKTDHFLMIMESDYQAVSVLQSARIYLLLGIAAVFFLSTLMLRWMLNPLKHLSKGLNKVSMGQVSYRLPVANNDELGELSRQFNRMAQQIEQMFQSRQQLLLDVNHELRAPLTRMRLSLAVMPQSQEREEVENDIIEMDEMLSRLLDSARQDYFDIKLHKESADIVGLTSTLIKRLRRRKPGIILDTQISRLFIPIDPYEIKLVISNILDNALKYSAYQETPVIAKIEKTLDSVEITVKDNGYGIASKHLPHLFKPFYRVEVSTSPEIKGYGLGLNLCKKIVVAHGGTIKITSPQQKGTIVTLNLPLSVIDSETFLNNT